MGFGPGTPSKRRAVSLHRAALRAVAERQARGEYVPALIPHATWESYLANTCNVGSRMQASNYNWLLERLGLIEWKKGKGGGIRLLESDYSAIIFDANEVVA